MDVPISKASVNDLPDLIRLVNSAYRGEEARMGWTHEAELIEGSIRTDKSSLEKLLDNPNAVILKYHTGQALTGCVYLEKQGSLLYLGMLSVSPRIQSQGIGKSLLRAAEAHARELGCNGIEMTVISVRHELIAWYERNGYRKTGEKRPFPDDHRFGIPRQKIEFIVMRKHL